MKAVTTGEVYGKWLVIEGTDSTNYNSRVKVRCDCGVVKDRQQGHIQTGRSRSCGCSSVEHMDKRTTTHGLSDTSEYHIWQAMWARCHNPNSHNFYYYGHKGVSVCPEWVSFEAFYADMGPRPSVAHSLDREKNCLGYSKQNCRWATKLEQADNRSSTARYPFRGQLLLRREIASALGITSKALAARMTRGNCTADEAALITSKTGPKPKNNQPKEPT